MMIIATRVDYHHTQPASHGLICLKLNGMKTIILAAMAGMLAGCSATRITHSWLAEDVAPREYQKIVVVALIKNNDRAFREKMEQHFVGDLTALGYTAVSSLQQFGPQSFAGITEAAAAAILEKDGADAVVTITLLDKEKESQYIPGAVLHSPYSVYQRRFGGYYSTISSRIYEPGYYAENTHYFWESNWYDLKKKELLYAVQTKSFNPASTESMSHAYGKMIVNDMVKKGLLHKKH
jgi:hypothetical protein